MIFFLFFVVLSLLQFKTMLFSMKKNSSFHENRNEIIIAFEFLNTSYLKCLCCVFFWVFSFSLFLLSLSRLQYCQKVLFLKSFYVFLISLFDIRWFHWFILFERIKRFFYCILNDLWIAELRCDKIQRQITWVEVIFCFTFITWWNIFAIVTSITLNWKLLRCSQELLIVMLIMMNN